MIVLKGLSATGHCCLSGLSGLALVIGLTFVVVVDAQAAGRRGFTSQDYQFDGPKHGYDGRATGGSYCSYKRIPKRKCKVVNGKEVCKVKGWILRQHCY